MLIDGILTLGCFGKISAPERHSMFQSHPLAEKASAILFEKTDQRLGALLAQYGVRDSSELPGPLQLQLLERAMIGAAATTFPTGNLEMLQHGLRSVSHPAFVLAMERMALSCRSAGDAFEMARGVHAAIVLAGWGLPVAPFDLEAMCIRAKPSRDIDTVQTLFSADKGAYVGYSSCEAPFYLLLTDCIRTLRQLVAAHPRLSELRQLLARQGALRCRRIPVIPSNTGSPLSLARPAIQFRPSG
ncbi:MAG: hypothetical protein WB611_33285 [Stellaceae bacterium]